MKTYCYETRAIGAANTKLTGGMLHAESLDDAARRLYSQFNVVATSGDRVELADEQGRRVYLRLSLRADMHPKASEVLKQYRDAARAKYLAVSTCENKGEGWTCGDNYNCCDCGGDGDCGCGYCFSCNACDACREG